MRTLIRFVCLVTVSSVGCGGGMDALGDSCGHVEPCGGAIVGSWKLSSGCVLDSVSFVGTDLGNVCPTASATISNFGGTARAMYNADDTYSYTGDTSMAMHLDVPLSCFTAGKTCAGLEAGYLMQAQMDTNPKLTAVTCATSGTDCHCDLSFLVDVSEAGVYSTDQSTLTTTPTGGTASSDAYCVQGTELHDITLNMTMPMGPMGMAKISTDVVFTKQ